MISEPKLKEICENYNIDFENLMKTNPNILNRGNYEEICEVLNYLRRNLGIKPSNIEKCPSILYRNVFSIESNYEFLKGKNIQIKNVESCLHVLSSESEQLKKTFEYVKENYGIKSLENNTSILAVSIDIIESIEDLNIKFKNKNGNLAVAVGIEFGATNLENVKEILSSQEYKEHPELFTSETLALSDIEDISKLLKLDYWQDERYKKLLTSTILSKSKSMLKKLPILFKMAEHFNIDNKLTTNFLLKSPSQNYAIIKVLEERQEPLIVDGKLNSKFGLQPGMLLSKYGIDLKKARKYIDLMKVFLIKKMDLKIVLKMIQ